MSRSRRGAKTNVEVEGRCQYQCLGQLAVSEWTLTHGR